MPSPLLNSLTSLSQLGQVIHDKSEKGKAFQTLAVDRIYSKAQPRTVFENLEELAESLKELGQQQPTSSVPTTRDTTSSNRVNVVGELPNLPASSRLTAW